MPGGRVVRWGEESGDAVVDARGEKLIGGREGVGDE